MIKMSKLDYLQVNNSSNKNNPNEVTFSLKPLERGFGNTLAVALRRVILSHTTSLALFAVRIEGVSHEFQTIPGVVEDVTKIILNLRKVRFQYDPEFINDSDIIKVSLNVDEPGKVTSRSLEVSNSSIEIINKTLEIATLNAKGSLHLEMFIRPGRGFISNEENKKWILSDPNFAKVESSIKKGLYIATDSNFSPIENVKYTVQELNSSSNNIEEELLFTIRTDGTVQAKNVIQQACEILVAHFNVLGNISGMKLNVFNEENEEYNEPVENDIDINSLNLSVRSLNALRRIEKTKISQIAAMTYEELEQTKNLGKKSLDEIIEVLKDHGYTINKGDE